jgi:RES domain-containing protein
MTLWRISNHGDLEGLGGERSDGRWHTAQRGSRIVYLAEHPALALIEALANLKGNPALFPERYQLMKINASDSVSTSVFAAGALSTGWRENLRETQSAGNSWLAEANSALLAVPSAPSPESLNYLFNPRCAEVKSIVVEWCRWLSYDKRLFRIGPDQI